MPTSIAVLRLSNEKAIGIADERTLYGRDQGNIASKISINGNCVVLTAGDGTATEEIIRRWNDKEKSENNFSKKLENLTEAFHEVYISRVQRDVLSRHNIKSWKEYQTGKLESGELISEDLHKSLQNKIENYTKPDQSQHPPYEAYLIFTGNNKERNDMEIYNITGSGLTTLCPDRFSAMGTGASIINKEFFDFLESLPAERRDNIEFSEGLYTSMKAYLSSTKRAFGVEGVPTIIDIGKDYTKRLDSTKSRTMRNVVAKEKEIGTEKVKTYLEGLATDKIGALTVAEQVSRPEDLLKYNLS